MRYSLKNHVCTPHTHTHRPHPTEGCSYTPVSLSSLLLLLILHLGSNPNCILVEQSPYLPSLKAIGHSTMSLKHQVVNNVSDMGSRMATAILTIPASECRIGCPGNAEDRTKLEAWLVFPAPGRCPSMNNWMTTCRSPGGSSCLGGTG